MRLAEAFLFRGRMMLPGAKVLTSDDTDILLRKYPNVMLKVVDPVLDSIVNFEDDTRDREVALTVTQKISSVMCEVHQKFSQRANVGGSAFAGIQRTVADVVEYLKDHPVSAALMNRNGGDGTYLAEHAGNVFYLSMVLGSAVRDYVVHERHRQTHAAHLSEAVAMDLLPLGLGAMFLDLGMNSLAHIFALGYELTADDRQAILAHPDSGADMLPESMPVLTRFIVRQHHENFDGTGYPQRLTGSKQHVFVRIVRLCDAFDAATSEKLYRGAKSPARVLWEMTAGPFRRFYDPILAKVFCGIIQPFPIGAKLVLADGRTAAVVRYNRRTPFEPTVVIAWDESGDALPPDRLVGPLNVGEDNDLRLKSFAGEDLGYVQDMTASAAPTTDKLDFADLLAAAYP
jgi:response regulator RpfG family c-di-GMP phosphodiesterase